MKVQFYALLVLYFLVSCSSKDTDNSQNAPSSAEYETPSSVAKTPEPLGYNLSKPDKLYSLPASLDEISGMQYIGNNVVACIQDEDGIIFYFDLQQERVVREFKWGEKGDYEGIAGTADTLFVLKSNGTVYQVSNLKAGARLKVKKLATGISKACDAEGLFMLPSEKILLLACKEGEKGMREIKQFSLQKGTMLAQPYRSIPETELEDKLVETGLDKFSLGIKKLLDPKSESGVLASSGIARHPLTQQLFILSSASKLLVVLTKEGALQSVEVLTTEFFNQPESITFLPDGTLLIGNESGGRKPNILLFKYES